MIKTWKFSREIRGSTRKTVEFSSLMIGREYSEKNIYHFPLDLEENSLKFRCFYHRLSGSVVCRTTTNSMTNKKKARQSSTTIDDDRLSVLIKRLKQSVVHVPNSTCWHSTLKVNGRGHVQIKYKGIKYLGHRIMACAKTKPYKYIAYDTTTKIDASHLCGNRQCINPDHIQLEPSLVNQTRDCCRMFGQKPGYRCPHEPVCVGCHPLPSQPVSREETEKEN